MAGMAAITPEQREAEIKARVDFKQKRADVKQRLVEENRKRAEAAEAFSVEEFVMDAELTRRVYVDEIDRTVEYKKLTNAEYEQCTRINSIERRGQKMLYLMLHKATPSVTEDQIKNLGHDVSGTILSTIMLYQSFLGKA